MPFFETFRVCVRMCVRTRVPRMAIHSVSLMVGVCQKDRKPQEVDL